MTCSIYRVSRKYISHDEGTCSLLNLDKEWKDTLVSGVDILEYADLSTDDVFLCYLKTFFQQQGLCSVEWNAMSPKEFLPLRFLNRNLVRIYSFTHACYILTRLALLDLHFITIYMMALRRIFGPKREKVTGQLGKFRNEELHNLYASPNVIRTIKSRKMRW